MENRINFVNMEIAHASLIQIYSEFDKSFMEGKYNFSNAQKIINAYGNLKAAIETLEKIQELIAKSQENAQKSATQMQPSEQQSNSIQLDNKSNSKSYDEEPAFV